MPLFPLNTVLFPYAKMQLHIFEDRYLQLVRDCSESEQSFGIALIRSGEEVGGPAEPFLVGTAARISNVQMLDDGKMDVRVSGERRFRIRKIDESLPYLVGMVEPVVEMDVLDNPRTDALVMRVRESFRALVEASLGRPEYNIEIVYPSDPTALSFMIANTLHLENDQKQRLLETTDTLERIADLIRLIEVQIVEAKPTAHSYRLTSHYLQEWINPN
ncbi:MAG: Lon protease 2 [Fimbriimonadaceae bacterium]|nr:Lon protease 2 [Fimbriimonadaceae bacterium]